MGLASKSPTRLCPWTPLGALPPDSGCRFELCTHHVPPNSAPGSVSDTEVTSHEWNIQKLSTSSIGLHSDISQYTNMTCSWIQQQHLFLSQLKLSMKAKTKWHISIHDKKFHCWQTAACVCFITPTTRLDLMQALSGFNCGWENRYPWRDCGILRHPRSPNNSNFCPQPAKFHKSSADYKLKKRFISTFPHQLTSFCHQQNITTACLNICNR